jgi:hypothetical protein
MSAWRILGIEIGYFIVRDQAGLELVTLERAEPGTFFGVIHTTGTAVSWDVHEHGTDRLVCSEPLTGPETSWNTRMLVKDGDITWRVRGAIVTSERLH